MTCPSCQYENRPNAKFCGECGAALERACRECGADIPPGLKFCDECGTPVAEAPTQPQPTESEGARKVVSILFADLVGSTALHERLDPESARRFMESYYAAAREAVGRFGGTVTQFLGDGVKAVFGVPQVAEDDAIRAVRAGVAMQEAFQALAKQQRAAVGETGLRVAVNTGEVVAKGETEIIGDPVNVAARLQERGRDGDVVIGEDTQRLVAGEITLELLGSFDLKGRAVPVKGYRVVSLDPPGRGATAAFVGREDELRRISSVYEDVVSSARTRLAVLLGSPGLGKSRLIGEFARRRQDDATVLEASCDAAGGATFEPIADAIREFLSIETTATAEAAAAQIETALPDGESERSRIAAGVASLLAGNPGAPEETFFVVRRFLAGLARHQPVVLLIDDLQWGEPLFLDLIEHLVQWGQDFPLLLLVGARPELREVRSTFTTKGGVVDDVTTLDGLDATAAMRLAAGVLGATDLPSAVAAKVLATSEGNPLFISELVRMLVDEGALTREGNRWTVGESLATVEMPPTIHALLAARIERLDSSERAILERAAVVGRQFSRSSVASLLESNGTDLDTSLESLQRAELIERDAGWFLGEPVLRFHHVLIRDAAYRRLLKGTRAELHQRHADWIETQIGEGNEHDETIGRHLEEAHRLLEELGPLDDAGRLVGERAAARLSAAGRRALAADDVALSAGLLGRALQRLTDEDSSRAELALDWCEALLSAGDVGAANEAIAELDRRAGDSTRLRAWHDCYTGQHTVLTKPEELSDTVEVVARAAKSLADHDDAAGEAKGHYVHALALSRLGRVGACEASLDQALAAARRAGDRRRANTVLAIAPLAALWGPSPVTRASGRCLDVVRVLRITQGAPAVEAVALSCQGVLEALRGRGEAAHRMIASAREMVEELGIAQRLFETDVFAGFVALLENDMALAERHLEGAYQGLRDLGLGIDAARAAALLARALLGQRRIDEAEALSHQSEALAGDDLKAAIAWRGVRAEVLARQGNPYEAVRFAQAAVSIAAATDALLDHADARRALAVALRADGQLGEANREDVSAQQLLEEKGASFLLEQRSLLGAPREGNAPARSSNIATASGSTSRATAAVEAQPQNRADSFRETILDAWRARDWKALENVLDEGLRFEDRRRLAQLELDRAGWLDMTRALADMSSARITANTLAARGERLVLWHIKIEVAEGDVGPSLVEHLNLLELNAEGTKFIGIARYDLDDTATAYSDLDTRYEMGEGAGSPSNERSASTRSELSHIVRPNAAAHSLEKLHRHRDVASLREAVTPDFEFHDRSRGALVSGRFEEWSKTLQFAWQETNLRQDTELLAIAGDRLSLQRVCWHRADGEAPVEIVNLRLAEVDEHGKFRCIMVFSQEDEPAARDALAERLYRGGKTHPAEAEINRSVNEHDTDRMRRAMAKDFVAYDHRLAGFGRLDGPDAYLQSLAAYFELVRDLRVDAIEYVARERWGYVSASRSWGTNDVGGAIETEFYVVAVFRDDKFSSLDMFDLKDLDAALARLEELRPPKTPEAIGRGAETPVTCPDPLEIPANDAAHLVDRIYGDQDVARIPSLRNLLADGFRFDDQTSVSQLDGGPEEWLQSLVFLWGESQARVERKRLAALGDRLVMEHCTWRNVPGRAPFELANIRVSEMTPDGQLGLVLLFNPEDRATAYAAMFELYVAHGTMTRNALELVIRWNSRELSDPDRASEIFTKDFTVEDHRWTGIGRIEGAAAYADSVRALQELVPDARLEILYNVAIASHGALGLLRMTGSNREGGAVESVLVSLSLYRGGKIYRIESYEVTDLDRARQRLEDLAP